MAESPKSKPAAKPASKTPKKPKEAPASQDCSVQSRALEFVMEREQRIFGGRISRTPGVAEEAPWGLRLPALSVEKLLGVSVWPLERVVQLFGEEQSFKSNFLYWLFGQFVKNEGSGCLGETENKASPDLWSANVSVRGKPMCGFAFVPRTEDWQKYATKSIQGFKAFMAPKNLRRSAGVGRTIPALIAIDSVAGTLSEATAASIEAKGYAEKSFPTEAGLNSRYVKAVVSMIAGYPISAVFVNHQTEKLDTGKQLPFARKEYHIKGGRQLRFSSTQEIHFRVTSFKKLDSHQQIRNVTLTMAKNQVAFNERRVSVPILLWSGPDPQRPGKSKTRIKFLWHTATINLLTRLQGKDAGDLQDIVDFTAQKGNRWSSKKLGISPVEAMRPEEMGALLMKNVPVLSQLRVLLDIKEGRVFRPHTEYEGIVPPVSVAHKTKKAGDGEDEL